MITGQTCGLAFGNFASEQSDDFLLWKKLFLMYNYDYDITYNTQIAKYLFFFSLDITEPHVTALFSLSLLSYISPACDADIALDCSTPYSFDRQKKGCMATWTRRAGNVLSFQILFVSIYVQYAPLLAATFPIHGISSHWGFSFCPLASFFFKLSLSLFLFLFWFYIDRY